MKFCVRTLCAMAALAVLASHAWAGDSQVKIGGTFYFDYFAIDTEGADEGPDPVRGFQLRRSYLTVKKGWGEMLFRYTSDVGYSEETGNLNMYTKYAYLERACRLIPDAKLVFGLHSPQTQGWTESRWRYRSMEKTLSDRSKWTHAAQLGLGLQGEAAGGALEYYLDLNNGNGYKQPLAKDGVGFSGRLALQPVPGLQLSGMFSSDTPGGDEDQANRYVEGLAGYDAGVFEIYGLYGLFTDGNADDLTQSGLSVFGRAAFMENAYAVARFDRFDPNTDSDDDGHDWMLFGLDFELHEGFHFQPSLRITRFQAEDVDEESEFVATFYGSI